MIKEIIKCNDPDILAITPLRKCDKISKNTKKSIKRNKVKFEWISYSGDGNPYKNMDIAYKEYQKLKKIPDYIIKVDNDITASRHWLDSMYNVLKESGDDIAYAFTSFEFTGYVNVRFDNKHFDANKLVQNNYISSMSLIKTKHLEKVGGFVTDDRYFRLLDWCLWLKFLMFGYKGIYAPGNGFVAYSGKDTVSARSNDDYRIKRERVRTDFCEKIKI